MLGWTQEATQANQLCAADTFEPVIITTPMTPSYEVSTPHHHIRHHNNRCNTTQVSNLTHLQEMAKTTRPRTNINYQRENRWKRFLTEKSTCPLNKVMLRVGLNYEFKRHDGIAWSFSSWIHYNHQNGNPPKSM